MADFQDRTLQCQDCGADFTFEGREQQFYADKGFGDPKRCKDCRNKKKEDRFSNRTKTKIVCANCKAEDEVNFVPREGGPPVLCTKCWREQRDAQRAA